MNTRIIFGLLLTSVIASTSFAQETTKSQAPNMKAPHPVITQQQREKMAAIHEKMAACLRSDRLFHECRSELHERCMSVIGKEGCPMMSEMDWSHERHEREHEED